MLAECIREETVGRAGLIWIICTEPQDDVAIWSYHDGVTSHWHSGECLISDIVPSIVV